MFWYLEDAGLLDIADELQLFIWRLVFTPKINEEQNSLDNHQLRITQNRTPDQLWVLG